MTTPTAGSSNRGQVTHVTTNTGRILRVDAANAASAPRADDQVVREIDFDPARRADVLFRVRREEGQQVSAWWLIGAFVAVSGAVIALLSLVPGGA